jgi:hypothetical protein
MKKLLLALSAFVLAAAHLHGGLDPQTGQHPTPLRE